MHTMQIYSDRGTPLSFKHESHSGKTLLSGMLAAALLLLAAAAPSYAQKWEAAYGSAAGYEEGQLRTIPVTGTCSSPSCCPGSNGYIAVGSTFTIGGTSDIYVVRTDNNGGTIWEYTYTLTNNGDWEYGRSIIELKDGTGFVITGEILYQATGDNDAYLMKIDCNGNVVWQRTYGTPNNMEWAHDVVETTSGPNGFIVCGAALIYGNGTGIDAMLLRTNLTGTTLWFKAYDLTGSIGPSYDDGLYQVTQAKQLPWQSGAGGDVIAVGFHDPRTAPRQAAVLRVDGSNGNVGTAGGLLQGVGLYGSATGYDEFYGLVELKNENGSLGQPNVVMCGVYSMSNAPIGTSAIRNFVVKLNDGNPCNPIIQRTIYEAQVPDETQQIARFIRQIDFNTSGYSGDAGTYDLVMTGLWSYNGQSQAYLLGLNPATLVPNALNAVYGGNGYEEGFSVYPVNAVGGRTYGFVVCGTTGTDWDGSGDPEDMYLVKTDGFGATDCEGVYPTVYPEVTGYTCPTPTVDNLNGSAMRFGGKTLRDWGLEVCPAPSPKPAPLIREFDAEPGTGSSLSAYPNPIKVGEELTVDLTSRGMNFVRVADLLGNVLYTDRYSVEDSKATLGIPTKNWESGTYLVTVTANGSTSAQRIVVVD